MAGILYADEPSGFWIFLFVTVLLGGAFGVATGSSIARSWRPVAALILPALLLAAAVRFLHYALFGEDLLDWAFYLVALVVVGIASFYGYRRRRVVQMTRQYPWIFRRSGPFSWAAKSPG